MLSGCHGPRVPASLLFATSEAAAGVGGLGPGFGDGGCPEPASSPHGAAASRAFPWPLRRGPGHDIFRPPAFASRSSDARRGIGPSLRSAYRTQVRTSMGLPRSARMSYDRGGCPLYPEDDGAHPGRGTCSTGACRSTAASPSIPATSNPSTGAPLRGINEGSSNSPVRSSPHPQPPDGPAAASAFPRASHPADQEPDDARRGGDRPTSTDQELHAQHHIR